MKVSVAVITYRHENLIESALAGAVSQKFDGELEILVHDDCSPDGTWEVVRRMQQSHPHLIRSFRHDRNVGAARNFIGVLGACTGEYVALLEGDDQWTDPHKLLRQVELLAQRPDASFCFHRVAAVDSNTGVRRWDVPDQQHRGAEADLVSLASLNCIATCSVVFRRAFMPTFDEAAGSLKVLDWPLFLLLAARGPGLYIDAEMAHYRLHAGGTHSALGTVHQLKQTTNALEWVRSRLPALAQQPLSETIARHYFCRMLELEGAGKGRDAWAELWNCYRTYRRVGQYWKPHLAKAAVSLIRRQGLRLQSVG